MGIRAVLLPHKLDYLRASATLIDIYSFDSESSLAIHRLSAPVNDMLSWLQNSLPNGTHPLPLPIPLQLMKGAFVRPAARETYDPFVVITQIEYESEALLKVEAMLHRFGVEIQEVEDVLMYLPGRTDRTAWVITAYRSRQTFEDKGLTEHRFGRENAKTIVQGWLEHFLELKVGYMLRC